MCIFKIQRARCVTIFEEGEVVGNKLPASCPGRDDIRTVICLLLGSLPPLNV